MGLAAAEGIVADDVFQEGDVGLHSADAELAEGAVHPLAGGLEVAAHRGELHQHRVVERRDHRAGVAGARVEADPEAGGGAVVEDAAVVGREAALRVLGGDAALDGVAVARDLGLLGNGDLRAEQRVAFCDENLRADEVDAGDALGHRMLNLDARVHLDEEPVLLVHVVEELDGAGVVVADALGEGHRGFTEFLAHDGIELHRRCDLDDLLIATLDRAVAFVEVDDIAVLVAEDLDFDVLGAGDVAFEENRGVAEGVERFGLRLGEQGGELVRLHHHAHPAAAAAEGRLNDEGKADRGGDLHRLVAVDHRLFGAGQGGDVELRGQVAGGGLVAHVFQQVGRGADEGHAFPGAGTGEGGVFGQESVAGVDQGDAFRLGHRDDAFDIEVGADGALVLVELVGLVGLEAMSGEAVFFGEHRHRAESEFVRGAEDADGDFTPVGGEELVGLGLRHAGEFLSLRWGIGQEER